MEAHQDQNPTNSHNQPHSTTIAINNGPQKVVLNQAIQPQLANPIAETLREQDLGKAFLTMIPPLVAIILNGNLDNDLTWFRDVALCLLSLALVNLYCGICLSNMYPRTANLFRQVGIACTFASVFMVVVSRLPPGFVWLPIVSCVVCTVMCIFGLDY